MFSEISWDGDSGGGTPDFFYRFKGGRCFFFSEKRHLIYLFFFPSLGPQVRMDNPALVTGCKNKKNHIHLHRRAEPKHNQNNVFPQDACTFLTDRRPKVL